MWDYEENKGSSYLNYWDKNNLYGWTMSEKLPTFNFEWVEEILQFNEVFTKYYDNRRLILKKVNRVISFNQDEWLKASIEINTKLRTEVKSEFEKDFFKLMNSAVFAKTMENVRKHRDIKLVTTERRRNYLVSESNYYTTKFFSENLFAVEMKKTQFTQVCQY